jgi:hypothetical protein
MQPSTSHRILSGLPAARYRAAALALPGLLLLAAGAQAAAPQSQIDRLQEAWRDTIVKTPVPKEGCFTASYPVATWHATSCGVAPKIPLVPRGGRAAFTVGNGDDYAAVVSGLISSTVGSFPAITGLKNETGEGSPNAYSLQINSQFFASPTCAGAANPGSCLGWEQFVYLTGYGVFMQYWLINYNNTCPGGWYSYGGDCYTNSSLVGAPNVGVKKLDSIKLSGTAVANGIDTVVFSTKTKAYSTTGKDSVVDLAAYWNTSEWNVFGPGGGSQAVFNAGTSITVNVALTDGQTAAPTCQGDDGYTGETNNLNLNACKATGGTTPSIQFTESLSK